MKKKGNLLYEVGDVVKINPIILKQGTCNGVFINGKMRDFANKTAYIVKMEEADSMQPLYKLDIDDREWYWSKDMLVNVNYTEEKKKKKRRNGLYERLKGYFNKWKSTTWERLYSFYLERKVRKEWEKGSSRTLRRLLKIHM